MIELTRLYAIKAFSIFMLFSSSLTTMSRLFNEAAETIKKSLRISSFGLIPPNSLYAL
ncbi:hypothetical protein HYX00_01645 [Candidatus Woesearchaeota archaeon]|nr:hypothetical protein [Candidatus Woesearchaeota archaeon]